MRDPKARGIFTVDSAGKYPHNGRMTLRDQLLAAAEAHCRAHRISKARLATIVANDGKFFARLARGGDFTARTYERFMAYFARYGADRPPEGGR